MSKIDRRIVEMRFDNEQFEKGVSMTMDTLTQLKASLEFGKEMKNMSGLSQLSRDIDLSGMATGVENISDRLSVMGLVGKTVIEEMTKSAMNFAKKTYDYSVGQIVSGGKKRALNLEQASYRFKGLGVDVEKAMDSANRATLGTMYGFDAAAAAGSQLAASGVDVGDSLYKALRGTAGLASMTGSSFEDISHIVTTVAGNGRLMGMELNRLSARGLNVAAVLGKSLGKSEQDVRKMVSQGKISFEMFSDAMYEAFGEHATGASGLFSGAVAHAKAALARIGGDFAPSLLNGMRDVLLETRFFIDKVRKILQGFVPGFENVMGTVSKIFVNVLEGFDATPLTSVVDGILNVFKALWSILKPIGQAFGDIFPMKTVDAMNQITKSFADFTSNMILSAASSNSVRNIFKALFSVVDLGVVIFKALWAALKPVRTALLAIGHVVLKVVGWFANAITAVTKFVKWTGILQNALKPITWVAQLFVDALILIVSQIYKTVTAFKDSALGKAVIKLKDHFVDFGKGVTDVMKKATGFVGTKLGVMRGHIMGFLGGIKDRFMDSAFKAGIDKVTDKIVIFGKKTVTHTSEAAKTAKDKLSSMGSSFAGMFKNMDFTPMKTKLAGALTVITGWISSGKEAMAPYVSWMGTKLKDLGTSFIDYVKTIKKPDIGHFFGIVGDKAKILFGYLADVTGGVKDFGIKTFHTLQQSEGFKDFMVRLWEVTKDLVLVFKDYIVELYDTIKASETFQGVIEPLWDAFKTGAEKVGDGIGKILDAVVKLAKEGPGNAREFVTSVLGELKPLQTAKNIGEFLLDPTRQIAGAFGRFGSTALNAFKNGFSNLWDDLGNFLNSSTMTGILDTLTTGVVALVLLEFKKLLKSMSKVTDGFSDTITSIRGVFDNLSGTLRQFQKKIKADAIKSIAIAIGILVTAVIALALVPKDKLAGAMEAMTQLFLQLAIFIAVLDKFTLKAEPKKTVGVAVMFLGLAVSVAILASALRKFSDDTLDFQSVSTGFIAVMGLMIGLVLAINALDVPDFKMKGVIGMLAFAGAIAILSNAVVKIAQLDPQAIMLGLSGVIVLINSSVDAFGKLDKMENIGFSSAVMVLAFAGAVSILAKAVEKLGGMDMGTLAKGLVGVVTLMVGTGIALETMSKTNMNPAGLFAMAGMILALGVAMGMMYKSVEKFGELELPVLVQGLLAVVGIMAALVVALNLMPATAVASGAGIVALAIGISLLVPPLILMGSVPLETIGKALLFLVGVFGVLGLAGLVLAPLAPVIVVLSAAILALGVAVGLVAGGLGLFVGAMVKLSGLTVTELGAISVAIGIFIAKIPEMLAAFGEGLIELAGVIERGAPAIGKAVVAVVLEIIKAAREILPELDLLIREVADVLAGLIVDLTPQFLESLTILTDALFDYLEDTLAPRIVSLLEVVAREVAASLLSMGTDVLTWLKGLGSSLKDWGSKKKKQFTNWIKGVISNMINGIKTRTGEFVGAIVALPSKALAKIAEYWGKFKKWASDLGDRMKQGVKDKATEFVDGVKALPRDAMSAIRKTLSDWKTIGTDMVSGMIAGVTAKARDLVDSVKGLGSSALKGAQRLLRIDSPSKVFRDEVGKEIGAGMAEGITQSESTILRAVTKVSKATYESTKAWIDKYSRYNEYSLGAELQRWQSIQSKYKKGSHERLEIDLRIRQLQSEIKKKALSETKAWIDEEKYYRRLSLEDELKAQQGIQKYYAKGTEERKQADREVYRLKNDIQRESYNKTMKWLDDESYYKRLTLDTELKEWQKIQRKYKEGTEEREKADREIFRLTIAKAKDKHDKIMAWMEEERYYGRLSAVDELKTWQKLQSEYEEGTEERKQADREVYKLKNEMRDRQKQLDEEYYKSTKDINDRLTADIKTLNDNYDQAVKDRTKTLVNAYGLFDKVAAKKKYPMPGEMLLDNLKGQLVAFEEWQANIDSLSAKGMNSDLLDELREMGPQSLEQIEALNRLGSAELEEYSLLWEKKHALAKEQAIGELEGLKKETQVQINDLKLQAEKELEEYKDIWIKNTAELGLGVVEGFEDMNTEVIETVAALKGETETEFKEIVTTIKKVITDENWSRIGLHITQGITRGIRAGKSSVVSSMVSVAKAAIRAAQDALGIASPSKEFAKMGRFAVMGLSEGLKRYTYLAVDEAENMVDSTIDKVNDILNSDWDMRPVIRPVLDMSDMDKDALLFDNAAIVSLVDMADNTNATTRTNRVIPGSSDDKPKGDIIFNQTNTSPKALSRVEIYRQTKNQISTMKGVLDRI